MDGPSSIPMPSVATSLSGVPAAPNTNAAPEAVGKAFEEIFASIILRQMRQTLEPDGLFGQDNAGHAGLINATITGTTATILGGGGADSLTVNVTAASPTLTADLAGGGDSYTVNASSTTQAGTVAVRANYGGNPNALLGAAPVYDYVFTWKTPVYDGKLGSPHGSDNDFIFNRVGESPVSVSGPQALADAMSGAWVAFARTGDPDHGGMPHWPAYTLADRSTMAFDTVSRVVNDPGRNLRIALGEILSRKA